MKVPENDSEYLDNIEKFTEYFEKEWIPQNCELVNYKEVQNLIRVPYLQLNSEVWYFLNENYKKSDKKSDKKFEKKGSDRKRSDKSEKEIKGLV